MPDPLRYRFGPLERRGLIAGWRGGQILSVAAGLVIAVLTLRSRPSAVSVAVAAAAVVAGIFVASWPLAGRTPEQWLPTVVRWSGGRTLRSHPQSTQAPLVGHRYGSDGTAHSDRTRTRTAGRAFSGLSVLAVIPNRDDRLVRADPYGRSPIGVVADDRAGTLTAVLALRGHTFALLGSDEKQRRVAGWSGALASLARESGGVHRVQWVTTTVPDDGRALRSYLNDRSAVALEHRAMQSYSALLDEVGASACRHDVYLALQVRMSRTALRTKHTALRTKHTAPTWRTGSRGVEGASAGLMRTLHSLGQRLGEADVTVEGVLDPARLVSLLRRATETGPALRARVATGAGPAESNWWPWPLGIRSEWGYLVADATFHATYWIAEWPRVEVGPDFLGPLLLGPVRRTVSVVMEPLSPSEATRKVEQARTADVADAELRRRGGFLSTARRASESEMVVRREGELAEGHASFRFSGYVTVSASSAEELQTACDATEQSAAQARLDLRRLYGEQERGFTFTLPLCRGLS